VSFEIIESTTLGSGRIVDLCDVVVRAPDGETAHRDVVRHPGGVAILPIVDGAALLLRQYRVAVATEIFEIPAGKIDDTDQAPAAAAEREMVEEMGLRPEQLISLGPFLPSPGYTDEWIHLFVALGAGTATRQPDGIEERYAEIVRMPLSELVDRIDRGEVPDAKTQLAVYRWLRHEGSMAWRASETPPPTT
jgi:ADP-ribose pyrophosphatase